MEFEPEQVEDDWYVGRAGDVCAWAYAFEWVSGYTCGLGCGNEGVCVCGGGEGVECVYAYAYSGAGPGDENE